MVITGEWVRDDDSVLLPYVWAHVEATDGNRIHERFLVDSGADCSQISIGLIARLGFHETDRGERHTLLGIGGKGEVSVVDVKLLLETADGRAITINGPYLAASTSNELDVSILGREVLANFDFILSRRRNEVLLLGGNHGYAVLG
jgi:hypothetical protein